MYWLNHKQEIGKNRELVIKKYLVSKILIIRKFKKNIKIELYKG